MTAAPAVRAARRSWRESLLVYKNTKVLGMLFLGFSAGLPFLMVFSTLSGWLAREDISRATIGFFSWVGLTYSIKFFWAPVVDRLPLPFLTRAMGKRRSWMFLAMIGIGLGILGMSATDPTQNLTQMALFALVVAFSSATQDIAIDAYRIEVVAREVQGAMAATYQLGYRIAMLAAGGGAFIMAGRMSWPAAYQVIAGLTLVGIVTVFVIREPAVTRDTDAHRREERVVAFLARSDHMNPRLRAVTAWLIGALVCPFVDFIARMGWLAVVVLAFIGFFRISDILMGVMAYPFYIDLGFSEEQIGVIIKFFGFFMTILGAFIGGILVVRYGIMRPLLLAAVLVAVTNLPFAVMAAVGRPDVGLLIFTISADNLTGGLAGSVFIAYLSSLTSVSYTATQYALFSSLMTLPGKLLGGFTGIVVEQAGYTDFFLYAAAAGIPAIGLSLYLLRVAAPAETAPLAAGAEPR